MRPWVANVIGLALGFTIGGAALVNYFSRQDSAPQPTTATAPARRAPPTTPPASQIATKQSREPDFQPVELPHLSPPSPAQSDALPSVIHPDPRPSAGQVAHRPGSAVAGTGFFVAFDGSLLTAAHVVSGCLRTRIASTWVKPAEVQMVATDTGQDIALLRAPQVTPPATLQIGRPAGSGGQLFVLGYPASGGPLVPTETWAVLENAQFQPAPAALTDPRSLIWIAAPAVGHGFSGGPMLDPRNGAVVGLIRGMVDSTRLHALRATIPPSGMVVGPGSAPLSALLNQQGTEREALTVSGETALDAARRATVHVLCTY